MTTYLRTCDDNDRALLHELRTASEKWLAEKGLDQYQGHWSERAHANIDQLLDDRRFVALCDGNDEVLAVAALVGPDLDFWTEEDDLHSAWYVARLMVARHGEGAGARLLDALALAAALDGRQYLRLDCWRRNTGLHNFYEQQGFQFVRVEMLKSRESGALFSVF